MTMTAEQLEEQVQSICASLGPIHGKLLADGYEGSAEAVMEAGVTLNSLARRVIAAEKLVEALEEIRNCGQTKEPDHWKFRCMARDKAGEAFTAYREASK